MFEKQGLKGIKIEMFYNILSEWIKNVANMQTKQAGMFFYSAYFFLLSTHKNIKTSKI